MDILYKVMFSALPSTHSGVWYYILKDNGINVLQNLGISFDHTIRAHVNISSPLSEHLYSSYLTKIGGIAITRLN